MRCDSNRNPLNFRCEFSDISVQQILGRAATNRDLTNIRLIESPLTFHASLRKRLDDGLCRCYCVIASNGYDRPLLSDKREERVPERKLR